MTERLIVDIAVIFLAALVGGFAADRLKQSPIVGYILGGVLVGPYILGLIEDIDLIGAFAEIGVILLMFTLGIEFSISRLEKVKKIALFGGALQIVVLAGIGMATGYALLGLSPYLAFFLGCAVSISSTMIVLRALGEQGEVNSTHGQVMLGMLVVQDLAAILMVSLLPELHRFSLESLPALMLSLARSILFIMVIIYLAQKAIPFIMDHAARGTNTDSFLVLALALGVGIATISHLIGLSVSLGAFLAGLLISESDYAHEILGKIVSLRDAFVILFFVSVGMLVNPGALFGDWGALLAVLAVIIPVKFLVFFVIVRMFGYHSRVAFYTGMGMIQTGEFSFVLGKLGIDNQLIPAGLYNLILASSIITITVTPLFIRIAPYLYRRLREIKVLHRFFPEADLGESEVDVAELAGHVIVCGCGRVGRNIGAALRQLGLPFVVIDYDYNVIRRLGEQGVSYIYGDASSEMVLLHARPDRARMAVLALPDIFSSSQAINNLRRLNPSLIILARANNRWEEDLLYSRGATEVVQPATEAGLQMVKQLILRMGLPMEVMEKYLGTLFMKDYDDLMRKPAYESVHGRALKIREFPVHRQSPFSRKRLLHSGIRQSTGCTVVTIKKANGEVILNPTGGEMLETGDMVIVMGTLPQLLEFERMNSGKEYPECTVTF